MEITECGTHEYVTCDTQDLVYMNYDHDSECYTVSPIHRTSDGKWEYVRSHS